MATSAALTFFPNDTSWLVWNTPSVFGMFTVTVLKPVAMANSLARSLWPEELLGAIDPGWDAVAAAAGRPQERGANRVQVARSTPPRSDFLITGPAIPGPSPKPLGKGR